MSDTGFTNRYNSIELSRIELAQTAHLFVKLCSSLGIEALDVEFGYAWTGELEGAKFTLPPKEIPPKVKGGEAKELGEFGCDDVTITCADPLFILKFCHHGDIHLDFNEANELTTKIIQMWKENNWVASGP